MLDSGRKKKQELSLERLEVESDPMHEADETAGEVERGKRMDRNTSSHQPNS